MRETVTPGEIRFRKTWLQAIVDRVEGDVIRIDGDEAHHEAVIAGRDAHIAPGARSSVRKWRALRESNPPLQRERLTS